MNFQFIVLMSEKSKNVMKAVLIIFLIVILLFALFGFLGTLIEKTMKAQGKKVDRYMTNVVISRVCDKPKDFSRIAKLKNKICFFRASITPIILALVALITWLIYHTIVGNWSESIFDTTTGVGTLFYTFDFSQMVYYPPLGFSNIITTNTPHFLTNACMTNYFIFLFAGTSVVWYLINVQAYFARLKRIHDLKKSIYSKDLSTIDITHFYNLDKVNPHGNDQNKKVNPSTEVNPNINNNNQQ
jgi:hypothetical protein